PQFVAHSAPADPHPGPPPMAPLRFTVSQWPRTTRNDLGEREYRHWSLVPRPWSFPTMLSTRATLAAGLHLLTPEMHEDPYTTYREWQSNSPVFWDDSLRAWVVTRYHDVAAVLNDPRFSSNRIA